MKPTSIEQPLTSSDQPDHCDRYAKIAPKRGLTCGNFLAVSIALMPGAQRAFAYRPMQTFCWPALPAPDTGCELAVVGM